VCVCACLCVCVCARVCVCVCVCVSVCVSVSVLIAVPAVIMLFLACNFVPICKRCDVFEGPCCCVLTAVRKLFCCEQSRKWYVGLQEIFCCVEKWRIIATLLHTFVLYCVTSHLSVSWVALKMPHTIFPNRSACHVITFPTLFMSCTNCYLWKQPFFDRLSEFYSHVCRPAVLHERHVSALHVSALHVSVLYVSALHVSALHVIFCAFKQNLNISYIL